MIHIKKSSDKQFYVVLTAKNGEVLSTSETFKSKASAWKNIAAQAKCFNGKVTDHTGKVFLFEDGKKLLLR